MTGTCIRPLVPADAEDLARLVTFKEITLSVISRELAAPADYRWLGVVTRGGELRAAHRAMRWGSHLLMKGVFVRDSDRGSSAALDLVFALRDFARGAGYAGIVAWVEPRNSESWLARLLRMHERDPLLHRFEIPVTSRPGAAGADGLELSYATDTRAISVMSSRPMLEDFLGSVPCSHQPQADPARERQRVSVRWTVDGSRLVLSGCPCSSPTDLPQLAVALAPLSAAYGASAIEVPMPAADLAAALFLSSMKARRLSRTPVRVGRMDFLDTRSTCRQVPSQRVPAGTGPA